MLTEGLVIAVEPMLTELPHVDHVPDDDGWTIGTRNGCLAAHEEHTVDYRWRPSCPDDRVARAPSPRQRGLGVRSTGQKKGRMLILPPTRRGQDEHARATVAANAGQCLTTVLGRARPANRFAPNRRVAPSRLRGRDHVVRRPRFRESRRQADSESSPLLRFQTAAEEMLLGHRRNDGAASRSRRTSSSRCLNTFPRGGRGRRRLCGRARGSGHAFAQISTAGAPLPPKAKLSLTTAHPRPAIRAAPSKVQSGRLREGARGRRLEPPWITSRRRSAAPPPAAPEYPSPRRSGSPSSALPPDVMLRPGRRHAGAPASPA